MTRVGRYVLGTVLAGSVLANGAAAYVLGTYARNHGGWAYVGERLHAGGRVSAQHVASDNERRALFRVVPKVPGQIVFLGDSLTFNGPWGDFFPGRPVVNRGIGGATVRDGINVVRDGALSGRPGAVFTQFGTNDFGAGVSVEGFVADYGELLSAIRAAAPGAGVYVQSCVPARNLAGDTADPAQLREANARLRQLAADRGATFVDVYTPLATGPGGGLPAGFDVDGIHLTPPAYVVWVDAIRPFVMVAGGAPRTAGE